MRMHPDPISETSNVPSLRVFILFPAVSSPFAVAPLRLIGARCEPQWAGRESCPDKGSIRQQVPAAEPERFRVFDAVTSSRLGMRCLRVAGYRVASSAVD